MNPTPSIIETAIKLAHSTSLHRFHHGCVIYDKRGVIACGFNKPRTNPILFKFGYKNIYLHAESDAILKARNCNLNGASLLVVRVNKHGKLCNSKPCKCCMAMIEYVGIKHVYYSIADSSIVELML